MQRTLDIERFDQIEELQIGRALEKHHGIFNQFWALVRPRFTHSLGKSPECCSDHPASNGTAAVAFNKAGDCIDFLIAPKFWKSLTIIQKNFIVSHECLHVLLSHGLRAVNMKIEKEHQGIANVAMDVVVNSLLLDRFGFNREDIDPLKVHKLHKHCSNGKKTEGSDYDSEPMRSYVWRDNVLKSQVLPPNRSFEFYFHLLMQNKDDMAFGNSTDDHGGLLGIASGKGIQQIKDMIEGMSSDELESLKDLLKKEREKDLKEFTEIFPEQTGKSTNNQAGTDAGNFWQHIQLTPVIKKKKWETVIRHWVRKLITYKDEEQWADRGRRMALARTDCEIPSDKETEEANAEKVTLLVFQDTSGSCVHLAERFFNAIRSIPTTRFDIHAYCFDTEVYKIDLRKGELKGFGGTCFKPIEQEIVRMEKELGHKVYSFICSDGEGSRIDPANPDRYFWFLSEGGDKSCFPDTCHSYDLSNFE